MGELTKVLDRLGSTGRLLVAGIAVVTIGAVFYLVMSAGPAAYAPAFTNLSPRQAGDVEAALGAAGITPKLQNGGATVAVPTSQMDAARIAVAKAGIAVNGQQPGYEQLDKVGMGATQWQQDVAYQRAQQGELANQIMDIAGIQSATVNVTTPKQSLFLADDRPATASVLLNTGGYQLPDTSVRGIQRLVSGAVRGLTQDNVVITNERGELLTQANGSIGDAAATKLATEGAYSRRLESKAQQLLDTMLGPGKAAVVVNARMNLDEVTEKSVKYGPKKGVTLQESTEEETLAGGQGKAAGAAGTTANVPGYQAGTGSGNQNYERKRGESTTGVDQTVTDTKRAAGEPTRTFVSIAFAAPAPAANGGGATAAAGALTADMTAAAEAVQAFLGITPADITAGTATFKTAVSSTPVAGSAAGTLPGLAPGTAVATSGGGPLEMVKGYAKPALAGLGVLLLLFLARRALSRRQALLGNSEARWMPTLTAPPIPVEDIALPMPPSAGELEGGKKKALQARVEDLAEQRPNDVAQQLRGWLSEDS